MLTFAQYECWVIYYYQQWEEPVEILKKKNLWDNVQELQMHFEKKQILLQNH